MAIEEKFEVVPYDVATLTRFLSKLSGAPEHVVETKLHLGYFGDYFEKLGAKTIVVEHDYIDRDFLEDFAAYYVRCFRPYSKLCSRLHFFRFEFDAESLHQLLGGSEERIQTKQLKDNYLGFVVVKPLPKTIIGRTCLATYPEEGRRRYPTKRRYDAHLFGIPLTIETVAFQEQDTVVAACATSALWSIFQCTARLFGHSIPSPFEITKAASEPANVDTRIFPNPGLTTIQMAEATRKLPLEPYLVGAEDPALLRATLYAYLHAKIPAMLLVRLVGLLQDQCTEKGYHSVAVTGFSLGEPAPIPDPRTGMLLRAGRIDKLYVHDDQVGPFAKMEFDTGNAPAFLTTSWGHQWPEYEKVNAAPTSVLFPIYHKIRIPFTVIHDILSEFDHLIEQLRSLGLVTLTQRLEWDVYLTDVNEFKAEVARGTMPLSADVRRKILIQAMPRFLWRVTGWDGGSLILDMVFDGTDIEQGSFLVRVNHSDPAFSAVIHSLAQDATFQDQMKRRPYWQILQWFLI
ncbi:MAG: hypothetical protein L0211_18155, partial [Planctomycetaceae bacterium]|nr:hypothetical protein [Planctomycetaceae bacterium]